MPEQQIWREAPSQMCVHNARERWLRTRLENLDKLKDATGAYWNSLFPRWKKVLATRIGDHKYNERHFTDVWREIFPDVTADVPADRETLACEIIFGEIDRVLEEENFFYSMMDMEYGGEHGFFKHKTEVEMDAL